MLLKDRWVEEMEGGQDDGDDGGNVVNRLHVSTCICCRREGEGTGGGAWTARIE